MSDDKTEQPTERRLEDSREKGQVAERKNIDEAFTILVGTLFIFSTAHFFIDGFIGVFELGLKDLNLSLLERRREIIDKVIGSFLSGFIMTCVLGVLGLSFHLLINGFNFAPRSLSLKFEKLNPVNGFKNIFSKNTAYNFLRLTIYLCCLAFILFFVIEENISEIISASTCGVRCIADVFIHIFKITISLIVLVLIVLAAFDFRVQNAIFISQSKMTLEEVKREHKGSEGDPLVKAKRRQLALENARMPGLREMTHAVYSSGYLVGIVYHKGQRPFVVLRSRGESVTRQVSKLRSAGSRCVNLPEVAREFYFMGQVGHYLPPRSLRGISKILG